MDLQFERHYVLYIAIIPLLILLIKVIYKKEYFPYLKISHNYFKKYERKFFNSERLGNLLLYAGFIILLVALAGPFRNNVIRKSLNGEGISIVLSIDVSASMLARDFKPDRLRATKRVATEFVSNRMDDYIGIVLYAGESFTKLPLTVDKQALIKAIDEIEYGLVEDGTAIGMGLATAVSRIKDSNTKSKVIILMSDGENNMGEIDPLTAAELAKKYGIKVYTIGVGTKGYALTPVAYDFNGNLIFENRPVSIDEDLLKNIAKMTGGKYFRATDAEALQKIYKEIDALERSKISEVIYNNKQEYFMYFLIPGLLLILVDTILRLFYFKSFLE